MIYKISDLLGQLLFYCVKQPAIYLLMITGILMDFMIQLPFLVICVIEDWFRKQT